MGTLASVNLFARDLDSLFGFYADLFELPEAVEQRSPIFRSLDAGGTAIAFNGFEAYGLLNLEPPAASTGPSFMLTFEVAVHAADDALTKRATERGAASVKPPYSTAYGSRQAVLRDPEGNIFRINAFTP